MAEIMWYLSVSDDMNTCVRRQKPKPTWMPNFALTNCDARNSSSSRLSEKLSVSGFMVASPPPGLAMPPGFACTAAARSSALFGGGGY